MYLRWNPIPQKELPKNILVSNSEDYVKPIAGFKGIDTDTLLYVVQDHEVYLFYLKNTSNSKVPYRSIDWIPFQVIYYLYEHTKIQVEKLK